MMNNKIRGRSLEITDCEGYYIRIGDTMRFTDNAGLVIEGSVAQMEGKWVIDTDGEMVYDLEDAIKYNEAEVIF